MEERDRSRSPCRRASRVEQVVGRWLRRSRDSSSRERILAEGKAGESSGSDQKNYPVRLTVQVLWDPLLKSHGLTLSPQTPILVQDVTSGGPADGRLVPGDQLMKINNVAVDDLTPEQAADIVRECQDSVTMTVLRTTAGPKSSFITPEKRAILKSNPVKVRFAEEVEVNGHSQGNSLLFLPNVLKVYLENGQTKAFKFQPNTTVKDIVMTLKEKLSLSRIEHFSLVLEQLYSITKLLLLHDEERVQQVVQKREAHDYRCLFRVCFMPREPQDLLQDDPTSFEYLYLQGVNDVLQERFAVEMRCNTALRLAALHIQERLASCGQSPKTSLKTITKTWGIENFVSSTLLRNMREKDLRKAIGYHMKRSQSQMEPKQKAFSADQARTNYLKELSDLKSFGGRSFSATMLLQDRESMVTLLVGARYGVSQMVNHKLSIMSTLTEFSSITRIELLPESDRVSLVKIYLQDIKPITLLLESVAAKDLSCLVAGYCRLLVDPTINIFPWTDSTKKHRISAEEGYVSRCGSDSDDSSDLDMDTLVTLVSYGNEAPSGCASEKRQAREEEMEEKRRRKSSQGSSQKEGRDKDKEEKKVDASSPSENGENKILVGVGREEKRAEGEGVRKAVEEHKEIVENERRGGVGKRGEEESRGGEVREKEGERRGEVRKEEGEKRGGEVRKEDGEERGGGEVGKEGGEERGRAVGKEREEEQRSGGGEVRVADEQPSMSEASDSCRTDSRVLTSVSSDSLDALEEDDFISCSSSTHPHLQPHIYSTAHPNLLSPLPARGHPLFCLTVDPPNTTRRTTVPRTRRRDAYKSSDGVDDPLLSPVDMNFDPGNLCFAELSRMVDYLPSPPEASEEEADEEEDEEEDRDNDDASDTGGRGWEDRSACPPSSHSASSRLDCVFNFEQSDTRCYYNICSNVTPDSGRSPLRPPTNLRREGNEGQEKRREALNLDLVPILQPPPGFGDSSSEEEFFDANDRFTSPEDRTSGTVTRDLPTETRECTGTVSPSDVGIIILDSEREGNENEKHREEEGRGRETTSRRLRRRSRKRRSFMETDFTSRVSFPEPDLEQAEPDLDPDQEEVHRIQMMQDDSQRLSFSEPSERAKNLCPTVSSLNHTEGEPAQLESKPILTMPSRHRDPDEDRHTCPRADFQRSTRARGQDMEMEPDAMESKSVTALVTLASPSVSAVRRRVEPDGKESTDRRGDGEEEPEEEEEEEEEERGKDSQEGREEEQEIEEDDDDDEQEEGGQLFMSGMFGGHMYLAEIKEEEEEDGASSPSAEHPPGGAEGRRQTHKPQPRFTKEEEENKDGSLTPQRTLSSPTSCNKVSGAGRGVKRHFNPPSHPPPPPPTLPLPPLPEPFAPHVSQSERQQGGSRDEGMLTNPYPVEGDRASLTESHSKAPAHRKQSDIREGKVDVTIKCVPALAVGPHPIPEVIISAACSTFSDDDSSICSSSVDEEDESSVDFSEDAAESSGNRGMTAGTAETPNIKTPKSIYSHSPSANTHTLTSNTDSITTINCTIAKLDATADVRSTAAFAESTVAKVDATRSLDFITVEKTDESTKAIAEAQTNASTADGGTAQANVSIAAADVNTVHELLKEPVSPAGYLFPPCSPIIGSRLSASTLRGKIQSLPLYLSRSQETLTQTGQGITATGPSGEVKQGNPEVVSAGADDLADAASDDDSEVTLTPSEVEDEVVVETAGAEITRSTMSEVEEVVEKVVMVYGSPPRPISTELVPSIPSPDTTDVPDSEMVIPNSEMQSLEPKMDTSDPEIHETSDLAMINSPDPEIEAPDIETDRLALDMDIADPKTDTLGSKTNMSGPRMNSPVPPCPPAIVVTTQSLNGPGLSFPAGPVGGSSVTSPMGYCRSAARDSGPLGTGCGVFTICDVQPKAQALTQAVARPAMKPDFGCSAVLESGCETMLEGVQGACGCPTVYANCFSGGDSFDDELTVYEFSCRAQSPTTAMTQPPAAVTLPLVTPPPLSPFLSACPPSSLSPSVPRSVHLAPSPSFSDELSPLLSPLEPSECFLSEAHKDAIGRLRQRRYPVPPAGFQTLRGDVDRLLAILEGGAKGGRGGRHPRDTCPAHFGENKRVLHVEARRLMAGCQTVVRMGQSPEEMLLSLADSFQTLVELAGTCLWFSGCERCDRRNGEAVAGLADVGRAFREFTLAAERASGRRGCQDLSAKLLAKQCTALTASVFCLTQLFRTLTAL